MIYHAFKLNVDTEKNKKKINPTKAIALENALKKEGFIVFESNTGINGARHSLLIGSEEFSRKNIRKIISDLELPYKYQTFYTKI